MKQECNIEIIKEMWNSSDFSVDEIISITNLPEYKIRKIAKENNFGKKVRKQQIKLDPNQFSNFKNLWLDPNMTLEDIRKESEKVYKKKVHEDTLRMWAKQYSLPSRDYIRSDKNRLSLLTDSQKKEIHNMLSDPGYTIQDIKDIYNLSEATIRSIGPKTSINSKIFHKFDKKKFIKMWYSKDTKLEEIIETFGDCSQRTILLYAERIGLKKRFNNPENQRIRTNDIIINNMIYLMAAWNDSNCTISEITSVLGVAKKSIYNTIDRLLLGEEIPLNKKISSSGTSKYEREILDFIRSFYKGEVQMNFKGIPELKGKEIDIFVPEFNFGIEFNGLMHHSIGSSKWSMFNALNTKENKNKHLNKTEAMEEAGYQLFHIFENEFKGQKKRIWKSVIRDKFKMNKKIPARKTKVKLISTLDTKEFLDNNHLQGSCVSKLNYGLIYENEIVAIMTFGKGRGTISAGAEWELLRFCNKIGHSVIGGASKLMKHFERENNPKNIRSFANRRWSTGNLYRVIGFKLLRISGPNYFYFREGESVLFSRNKFQKHKLQKILEVFDPDKTEWENMDQNNFRKIYDSGNYVFQKDYESKVIGVKK